MPRRTSYVDGTPCWIDHVGVDPTGAKDFYATLFGWEFRPEGGRGYHLVLLGGEIVGGLGPSPAGPRFGSAWTVYLAAKDLDAAGRRAERHGAHVVVAGVPAGGNGRLSLAVDPLGAAFGLWQGAHDEGVVVVDEAGALTGAALHTPRRVSRATSTGRSAAPGRRPRRRWRRRTHAGCRGSGWPTPTPSSTSPGRRAPVSSPRDC